MLGQTTLANASSTNLTVSGNSWLGTIKSGVWNGTSIATQYGGTGQDFSASTGFVYLNSGTASATSTIATSSIQDAYLFNTGDSATGNYNFDSGTLFIDSANNRIGIGTTSPGAKLHIERSGAEEAFRVSSSTATTSDLRIDAEGITYIEQLEAGYMTFEDDAGALQWINLPIASTTATAGTVQSYSAMIDSASVLTVYGENNGSGGVQNLRVGIGNTAPAFALHVTGSDSATTSVAAFTNINGTCVINPTNAALECSSDINLKKNINNIPNALDTVSQLRGVTYNWNRESENDSYHYGFIAQEVEQILPELVSIGFDGFKAVNYTGFAPVLTDAIKELNLKVDKLGTENVSNPSIFNWMLQSFKDLGNGIVQLAGLVIGSSEKPSGITMYDKVTGDPYCIEIINGNIINTAGECGENINENINNNDANNISSTASSSASSITSTVILNTTSSTSSTTDSTISTTTASTKL
ncbi:tail fiber domain-containing protein [Patescibacteria group bacterium]|nr:tail fiber domain-containing protein [Patescibacteria group bacterium]